MQSPEKTRVEIIYGMTNKAYHAPEAIGSPTAVNFGKSALHATAPPEDPTSAMEFGSACHKWILEEDDFYDNLDLETVDKILAEYQYDRIHGEFGETYN